MSENIIKKIQIGESNYDIHALKADKDSLDQDIVTTYSTIEYVDFSKLFVGTYEAYQSVKDKIQIGCVVIITDDDDNNSSSTTSILGKAILGQMILG